jgi:type I restriction enzyme S subunit
VGFVWWGGLMASYQQYPHYKSTKCVWLNDVPSHWLVKRVKDIATYNDETLDDKTDPELEIEYVDISSVSLINGIEKLESMTFDKAPSRARRKVKHGDIIVSTVRTYLKAIAPVNHPSENMIVSTGFAVVRPRQNLHSGFAGYLLQSDGFVGDVVANSVGVSYPAINASDLVCIPVVEPPMHEQQVIANFLDYKTAQIDALIAKKEVLLTKLAEKRTALISHTVTKGLDPSVPMKDSGVEWLGEIPTHWGVIRIRHCVEFLTSGSRGWTEYFAEEGSLFLRITNVTHDSIKLKLDDVQYVLPPDGAEGRRTATKPDDVIISITADLGSVAVVSESVNHAYVSQHLALLRPQRQRVSGTWLAYQAFSLSGKAQLLGAGYGGSKIQLGLGDVKDVWIAIPSTDEQNLISHYLEFQIGRMDKQTEKVKNVITALKEYRSALITNAVTGKIDVRDFKLSTEATYA